MGAGSSVGGAAFATFLLTKSWLIYTLNDYFWDLNSLNSANIRDENGDFSVASSLERTTPRFLTYQSINSAVKFAAIYAATGSVEAMGFLGGATMIVNSGLFYVNEAVWDLYDWSFSGNAAPALPLQ